MRNHNAVVVLNILRRDTVVTEVLVGLVFLRFLLSICFPFKESGREKSFRYWPRLGSRHNTVTYGRFKITTRFRTDSGCYATTGLKIKHLLTGQERTVWHLQYTDWPKHGCPEDLKGFLCKFCLIALVWVCLFACFLIPPKMAAVHYISVPNAVKGFFTPARNTAFYSWAGVYLSVC